MRRRFPALLGSLFAILAASAIATTAVPAVEPGERLADPVLEARARALSRQLRCVVCQNESIDESRAEIAHELRMLLRERLQAGDTDQQATDFLVRRYGTFVLLKPPVEPATYVLWFGPAAILTLGAAGIAAYLRSARRTAGSEPAPLTTAEQLQLEQLVGRDES